MIRKYHNHTLQTNQRHREEEQRAITRHQEDKRSKAISSLFPIKMISKTRKDTKQCTTKLETNTEPHNGSNNQQQQNHRLRTDGNLYHCGA